MFSKTAGWNHSSIPFGNAAIQKLGKANHFQVDTTKNAAYFNDDSLRQYQAVIFNCTSGHVLNPSQRAAFERYIQAGGGYVGIHSAAATEYDWRWYGKLMGAFFSNHPRNPVERKAAIDILDKHHPSTAGLPDRWERVDEWYSYRSFYPGIKVLANLDETTYDNGTHGSHHPIAWYHEFDGGRAFYTGGGHADASYEEPLFLNHILGGITYAMGNGKPLDYSKSYAKEMIEENRFVKTVLINDLDSPMEIAVSDDGRIFFTEMQSGQLVMYNTVTHHQQLVHTFELNIKGGTGLLGVALDPHFSTNHFLYVYYSKPKTNEPYIFNLSRFTLKANNTLDMASERVLLQVPVQEMSGRHQGGSLAWDKEGNLYLSTGDSSSPFASNGYAPLDERPGPQYLSLDAQRSASNTNDFKGKILRIHPEADGSAGAAVYTIPEGNLFPKGLAKTRPEIYAMGLRNPYRIAVNPKTSVVYWGDIGPDAGTDSTRGPKGYDEFNQAKQAGNFGWPYFVGNNQAYAEWDFATKTAGAFFNPKAPVNNSPNNTGLTQLPPAMPAMIWYPYIKSTEFPELGNGGRSAMAGAFYTFDKKSPSKSKFPEYYDGALFVFDWMRNWVMALRFDANENYLNSEQFMPLNGDFRRPIDLTFGKDGVMYMLEYGSIYGADNEDARLVKIEYNTGNRPPIAHGGIVDSLATAQASARTFLTSEGQTPVLKEVAGQAPLRVSFSSQGTTDLDDDDQLTYQWLFEGKTVGSTQPNPMHTFTKNGIYKVLLKVTDRAGAVGLDTVLVKVGNTLPEVRITSTGNQSFYWENKPFHYSVQVNDKEDKQIDPKKIKVYFNYNPQPSLLTHSTGIEKQTVTTVGTNSLGKKLINNSDCKACHTIDKVSVGPSFTAVANRYKSQSDADIKLMKKIIAGGGGSWGTEHVMSAHPQLSQQEAREMVKYIFSLTDKKKPKTVLPAQGTIALQEHQDTDLNGQYSLQALYTDKGGKAVGPLTNTDLVTLRRSKVLAIEADAYAGFTKFNNQLIQGTHKSYILLKNIDLTGIKKLTYTYAYFDKAAKIEVRIDSYAGPIISQTTYEATGKEKTVKQIIGALSQPIIGKHDLYFVVVKQDKPNDDIIGLSSIQFDE
ncbi:MAG: ThuA domain-containing protein [Bacteroidota bacterium]